MGRLPLQASAADSGDKDLAWLGAWSTRRSWTEPHADTAAALRWLSGIYCAAAVAGEGLFHPLSQGTGFSRDGVVTTAREGMATRQTPQGEPKAAQPTMARDGDVGILAASGKVLALGGEQKVPARRENPLVKTEQGVGDAFAARAGRSGCHEPVATLPAEPAG